MECGHLFYNLSGLRGHCLDHVCWGIWMVHGAAFAAGVTNRSAPCKSAAFSDPPLTSEDKTKAFVESRIEYTSTSQVAPLPFALTMLILITQPEGALPKIKCVLRIVTWGNALYVPSHRCPQSRCRLVHAGASTCSQPPPLGHTPLPVKGRCNPMA